ncbi:MAG TPA: DNA polymerase I [Flavobacteriales bacterium]|nr:DNA polymerase I [Flavobacteriales bacterium]
MPEKKLFLLDAFALIYRAHFAFIKNPRINSKGLNTSAVFGFCNTLLEVLNKENPTHIAVVFDAPAVTNRELEYSEYKANREEMPEDLRMAIPYVKQLIDAFNIPSIMLNGYEADDLIGTLAKKAEKKGFTTYMMTPDKDFAQLVSQNIFMYRPGRGGNPAQKWGVNEVCERFEVDDPIKVIDILGLWGDSVDNIPGIPGIGEKTSKKLIKQYGSVENLIANAHELKGKQQENVINFAEQGLLSKKLATIILDAPVELDEQDLKVEAPDEEKILSLFSELEFRALSKRVLGENAKIEIPAPTAGTQMDLFNSHSEENNETGKELKSIENVNANYTLIVTEEERLKLISILKDSKTICFDTETTGINAHQAELVGLCFSVKKGEGFYVPISEEQETAKKELLEFLPVFHDESIEKVAQNIKYDLTILKRYGIEVKGPLFDTMIAHYLFQPDMKHGMDLLAENYLNYKTIPIESLIGKKGKNQRSMRDLDPKEVLNYAAEDADITLQLKDIFAAKLKETNNEDLFNQIEIPLSKVLAKMEMNGVNLDKEVLESFSNELDGSLTELRESILSHAGVEFNLDSPKQLGEVLFDHLKIDEKAKKTKTGQYQTNEDTLLKLVSKHPIIQFILDYRSLKKLKSTYVSALPNMVNPSTGRIHTSYMQTVAATGRLSSNNPNLQNIPIRTEKGREIRKAFIPKNDDFILLAADYSQIELRIIAALSKDQGMVNAFNSGTDIHSATASKVFDVELDQVTREQRSKAKMVNFGIIYGISAFGLSQRLNIPRKEAKFIIDSYFEKYSRIKEYMDESIDFARKNGYVKTIKNRKRYLKDINSSNAIVRGFAERNAINAPIQGSAADVIKIAMINIDEAMEQEKLKSSMILQVHDELVFDVYKPELNQVTELVKFHMENAVQIGVPLTVEMDTGSNWLEAH